jgi:uncharacterized protein YbjT (DUF2867 family)
MNSPPPRRPRMLVVGGLGGLVGRALLAEFGPDHLLRTVHRHRYPPEEVAGAEWCRADVALIQDWTPFLEDVDIVLNVAWYRSGSDRRFQPLEEGLLRLVRTCEAMSGVRFLHLSVPPAPAALEQGLPYLARKRAVDAAIAASALDYAIVRPTMLFGPGDKLLTVMLRTAARWHRLPLFGDGEYHISPIAARDLARIVRRELEHPRRGTVDAGGPTLWRYRDLLALIFDALQLPAKYVTMTPRGGRRLARLLETLGSSLLYAYEVDWLVSDRLGLPPYEGLATPLEPVEPFVRAQAARLRAAR